VPDLRTARLKPVEFIGSSKKDLSGFPNAVKQDIGHALFVAQQGSHAPSVKTLHGFAGGSIVEIVEDHDGDTYRCVYTTRLKRSIYVLHAFQKKSKRGRQTPKHEIDLVRARLREAEERDRRAEGSQR
jgi:phage-related protein